MSFKDVALALNELDKSVTRMPESPLKKALKSHIESSLQLLLHERIKVNQVKNFKLQQPVLPEPDLCPYMPENTTAGVPRRKYY